MFFSNIVRRLPAQLGTKTRHFQTSAPLAKVEDRKQMLASLPSKDEGTAGERSIGIDSLVSSRKQDIFVDANTPQKLFNGIPFCELPICHIRVSSNNTIVSISDHKGVVQMIRSCGVEGFKNARKGTNIAAQATAISLSQKAIERGIKSVRVNVRGLGPGRMSAIKGLQMSGMNIISITDSTRVSWDPPRPRKQRRL